VTTVDDFNVDTRLCGQPTRSTDQTHRRSRAVFCDDTLADFTLRVVWRSEADDAKQMASCHWQSLSVRHLRFNG